MQLRILLYLLIMLLPFAMMAQKERRLDAVDANFLFNYYNQDGDHSAVTGGTGTEELQDYASRIIVHVPVDSTTTVSGNVGVNYYSSASTDRIDFNTSSASEDDFRGQVYVSYEKRLPQKRQTVGFTAGGSLESDYISYTAGAQWGVESKDANRSLTLKGQAIFGTWAMIFPDELRATGQQWVDTDKRRTYQFSVLYSQVLHPRLQMLLAVEPTVQEGLLSTPFHRVYFQQQDIITPPELRVEKLPGLRIRIPVGMRLNYFLGSHTVIRSYYRFYADDWGVISNTANLELALKAGNYFTVYPFYRFYHQTESDYFAPFAQHSYTQDHWTSDYDLSGFFSHRYGVGIQYSPLWGVRKKYRGNAQRIFRFKSIHLRGSHYLRSDGLRAFMISLALKLKL